MPATVSKVAASTSTMNWHCCCCAALPLLLLLLQPPLSPQKALRPPLPQTSASTIHSTQNCKPLRTSLCSTPRRKAHPLQVCPGLRTASGETAGDESVASPPCGPGVLQALPRSTSLPVTAPPPPRCAIVSLLVFLSASNCSPLPVSETRPGLSLGTCGRGGRARLLVAQLATGEARPLIAAQGHNCLPGSCRAEVSARGGGAAPAL